MPPERAEVPATPWPMGPMPRPEVLTAPPNPIGLLNAFRRRWILATFLGVILGGILALIPYFLMPVRHDVATWLTVAEQDPYIVYSTRNGPEEFERFKSAQAQMLTTTFVLSAALRDSAVNSLPMLPKADPVAFLQKNISVGFPGDSTLMRISMKGEDPEQLKVLVNAVREAYLTEVVEKGAELKLRKLYQMEEMLDRQTRDISRKRSDIENLVKSLGTTPDVLARQAKLYEDEVHTLHKLKLETQHKIRQLQGQIAMAQASLQQAQSHDPTVGEHLVEQLLRQDAEYSSIKQQWLDMVNQLRYEEGKARDASQSPNRRLKSEILDLEEVMTLRRAEARQELAVQMQGEMVQQAEEALNQAQTDLQITQQHLEEIETKLTEMSKSSLAATSSSNQVLTLQAELDKKEEVFARLGREVEERTLESKSPPRVEPLQAATDEGNDRTMKYSIVGFSGLLGFLSAVFGVSFVEFQKRRVGSISDISEGLGVNVIGALPALSGNTWSKMTGRNAGAVRGMLSESIDNVRMALLHGEGKKKRKVVMVTSATAGEGKTTLSTQLAASLSRAGRRTLIIDADLRSPKAHRVFELPLEPGLSEVLRGEAQIDDVIRPTRAPGLWMITAGGCCHECIQALARDEIRVMFDKLRDEFDFVIVDSGPVLSAADSLSLAVCVDAAVLSVLKNSSQATKVYEAYERLDAVGVHVLGSVVNGVNTVVRRKVAALPARAKA